MIRVDAVWLAVEPLDMRAGTEAALRRVVAVFGAARPHHAYLFANAIDIPTPGGVLVLVKEERPPNPVPGRPDGLVGATWISDDRMRHNEPRLKVLQAVRAAGGLVVQMGAERLQVGRGDVDRIRPYLWAWTDVYFDEMVELLPRWRSV